MSEDLSALYEKMIMDHAKNPRNAVALTDPSHHAKGNNPLCGDRVSVYFNLKDNIIEQAAATVRGCAILKASASIMTEILKSQSVEDAKDLFEELKELLKTGKCTDEKKLGDLMSMAGIHQFPMRVKCATLPWYAMEAALDNNHNDVSSE